MSSVSPVQRRARILVVEDEPVTRRLIERVLAPRFHLTFAEDGREALAVLAQERAFDLVLSDLQMPNLDGFELHRELRRSYPELARRTIFMSGSIDEPEIAAEIARTGRPGIAKMTLRFVEIIVEVLAPLGLYQEAEEEGEDGGHASGA